MRATIWEVSICLATEDKYYIATGRTHGFLVYPVMESAYHFNKVFSVEHKNNLCHFGSLSAEDKQLFSPRIKAIVTLKNAFESSNFNNLTVISKNNVMPWTGPYQEAPELKKKMSP